MFHPKENAGNVSNLLLIQNLESPSLLRETVAR